MEAYFDNSATTRVLDSVMDIVTKTMTVDYANPATLANLLERDAPDVAMAIREEINVALARRLESTVE